MPFDYYGLNVQFYFHKNELNHHKNLNTHVNQHFWKIGECWKSTN